MVCHCSKKQEWHRSGRAVGHNHRRDAAGTLLKGITGTCTILLFLVTGLMVVIASLTGRATAIYRTQSRTDGLNGKSQD